MSLINIISRFVNLNQFHEPPMPIENKVYFFGDSVTEGVGVSNIVNRWSTQLCQLNNWVEVNFGTQGTTMMSRSPVDPINAPNMRDRADNDIPNKSNTDKYLFIAYGINDCGLNFPDYTLSNFELDYNYVIDLAISRGWDYNNIKIISGYYVTSSNWSDYIMYGVTLPADDNRYLLFRNKIIEIANNYNIKSIDLYSYMKDTYGDSGLDGYGRHPNDETCKGIANRISAFLKNEIIDINHNNSLIGFGDSFLVGYLLANPTIDGYGYKLSQYITPLSFTNYGVSSKGYYTMLLNAAPNIPVNNSTKQIFSMCGLNEARTNTTPNIVDRFVKDSLRTLLVYNSLKIAVEFSDPSITFTGTYDNTQEFYSSGVASKAKFLKVGNSGKNVVLYNNSTVSWTTTEDNIVLGYFTGIGYGNFTVEIDGNFIETVNTALNAGTYIDSLPPFEPSPAVKLYRNLGSGSHTIKITSINSSNSTPLDFLGSLNDPNDTLPIIIFDVVKMTNAGYSAYPPTGNHGSDEKVNNINNSIHSVINEFRSYGFKIAYINTNYFYDPHTADSVDDVHPDPIGHLQIARAAESMINKI